MRHFIQPMRECGAAMRQMLEAAAAAKWGVDPSLCRAKSHSRASLDKDKKETGEKLGFGDLAEAAMALPVPARETLLFKTPDEFTLMRKGEAKIVDLRDITMGKAVYGADVRLPGMKFAVMARPHVLGGKVKSFDADRVAQGAGRRGHPRDRRRARACRASSGSSAASPWSRTRPMPPSRAATPSRSNGTTAPTPSTTRSPTSRPCRRRRRSPAR